MLHRRHLQALRTSYTRVFYAIPVPLILSQGPSGPAQFLLILAQVYALRASSVFKHNLPPVATKTRQAKSRLSSLLPAMLYLASSCGLHYYSSGHDHSFSTIEFSCAYIGLREFHFVFSGLWSILNVGAFHIFHVMSIPFLAFGCGAAPNGVGKDNVKAPRDGRSIGSANVSKNDVAKSPPRVPPSALGQFQLSSDVLKRGAAYFGLWFAVEAVAAAACAAIHRRHLFVWVRSSSSLVLWCFNLPIRLIVAETGHLCAKVRFRARIFRSRELHALVRNGRSSGRPAIVGRVEENPRGQQVNVMHAHDHSDRYGEKCAQSLGIVNLLKIVLTYAVSPLKPRVEARRKQSQGTQKCTRWKKPEHPR